MQIGRQYLSNKVSFGSSKNMTIEMLNDAREQQRINLSRPPLQRNQSTDHGLDTYQGKLGPRPETEKERITRIKAAEVIATFLKPHKRR